METVRLEGAAAGHGINISDSADDGVVIGSVDHGSPAHQSDRIARGTIRYDTIRDAILTCARKPTRVSLIYTARNRQLKSVKQNN